MRRIIIFTIIISTIFSCIGCDGYEVIKKYPYYSSDSWYCAEINFTFFYEYLEDGRMKSLSHPLNHNGEILSVTIDFIGSSWYLNLDSDDDVITLDEQLLSGTWQYHDGNLVLHIVSDKLFNGKYQELVFVPGIQNSNWSGPGGRLSCHIDPPA